MTSPWGVRRWLTLAVGIMVLGAVIAILHRLGHVPLWAGTAGTFLTALGALFAAIAANRKYRNETHG